jgi:hypothetical protein
MRHADKHKGFWQARYSCGSRLPKVVVELRYSTVTLFARLRGWSTSVPLMTAVW